jgi:hypothetical protein
MEHGLEQGNPVEFCEQYISENKAKICENSSIEEIMKSGYAQCIKELTEWHFLAPSSRRNTFVIQGKTATGKTRLRDLWESIFPCHQYI